MLCSRVQNMLSAYCDSELTGTEMLRVRSHLHACPLCRREMEALTQVKSLFGALPSPAPARGFDPSLLDARPRPWALRARLLERVAALPPLCWLAEAAETLAAAGRERAQLSTGSLVLSGSLAILTLSAAVLMHPQHADAVGALVPERVAADDSPYYVSLPFVESLPAGSRNGFARPGVYLPGAPGSAMLPVSFTYQGSSLSPR